jgi:molecular chaperone GrpE
MDQDTHQPESAEPSADQAAEAEPLEVQLQKAGEDVQKYLANWQRAEADFQNYKRRVEQERDESRRFALASLVINLLPILDDFDRAFGSLDPRLAGLTWFDGMRLVHRKLQMIMDNAGVAPIEAEGQPFDPRYHEAVAHSDGEEGKVLAEVQRGYKLHDRVLRPAMVVVGKGGGSAPAEDEGEAAKPPEGGEKGRAEPELGEEEPQADDK